ncbi:hypothetical protein [Amycolatopsis sp. NPDC003861]
MGVILLQIGLCQHDTTASLCCSSTEMSISGSAPDQAVYASASDVAATADVTVLRAIDSPPGSTTGGTVAEVCLIILLGVLLTKLLLEPPALVVYLRSPARSAPHTAAVAVLSVRLEQLCVSRT